MPRGRRGVPSSWINERWTGVRGKRDGRRIIVQMRFSFANDD
jgi:hypothetical protein